MLKYIKYFSPTFTTAILIFTYLQGMFYPTIFLLIFSLIIIIGDLFIKDRELQKFTYPNILNLSIYINLPIDLSIYYSLALPNVVSLMVHNIFLIRVSD